MRVNLRSPGSTSLKDLALNASLMKSQKILWLFRFRSNSVSMATFESGGFSMALKKIATDSAESAYNPYPPLWRIVFHFPTRGRDERTEKQCIQFQFSESAAAVFSSAEQGSANAGARAHSTRLEAPQRRHYCWWAGMTGCERVLRPARLFPSADPRGNKVHQYKVNHFLKT